MLRSGLGFRARLVFSIFVIGSSLGGYFYYVGNSIESDVGIIEKIATGVSHGVKSISGNKGSFHTSFDFSGEFLVFQNDEEILSGKIKLEGVDIYANKTALQQKISADNIEIQSNIKGEIQSGKLKNLDIISDEENIYLSVGEGGKELFSYLENIESNIGYTYGSKKENSHKLLRNISEAISQGKFAHIDNGQPIKKLFSDLGENSWIPQLFVAMITSNPNEYLEKNKIYDEIKKELHSDQWIDSLFSLSENQVNPNKKTYALNKNLCKSIIPVVFELMKQSGKLYELKVGELLSECEQDITQINPVISLVTQIYKQGDVENGNYDFIVAQGNAVDIKITYANHILKTWQIFIQDPQNNKILLSLIGDTFGINESNLKISIEEEGVNINGEIINGTGEIDIDIDNNNGEVEGKLQFTNYKLSDMDIRGKSDMEGIKSNFSAQGNYLLGNINFIAKNDGEEVAKLEFDYTNKSYDFDFESINMDINSLYKGKKFIFAASKKDIDGVIQNEAKVVYNGGKLSGFLKDKTIELNLKGEIISIQEFIIEMNVDDGRERIEINVNAEKQNDNRINYIALGTVDKVEIFDFRAFQEVGEKEGNKTSIFEASLEVPSEKIYVTLQTEKTQKKPTKKYRIPENIETIEVNISEIITLPNFHQISRLSAQEVAVFGTALGAIGGTITYISSQRSSVDARNSKRISDLSNLTNAIEISVMGGKIAYEDLVIADNEKSQDSIIRVGGNKVIEGGNYFIGDINYELLGQNKDNFEMEGFKYKIAVYQEGERNQYQLLAYLEEGNQKFKVFVKGNYFPRTLTRYNFTKVENIPSDDAQSNSDEKKEEKIQIELDGIHDFILGDKTNLGIISEITGNILTFEMEIKPGVSKVYMLGHDSATLFVKNKKTLQIGQIIRK